jgi:hypothetical protein
MTAWFAGSEPRIHTYGKLSDHNNKQQQLLIDCHARHPHGLDFFWTTFTPRCPEGGRVSEALFSSVGDSMGPLPLTLCEHVTIFYRIYLSNMTH